VGERKSFNFTVDGGQVSAAPPLSSALGPLGVNLLAIVNKLNELTASFKGMKVPVTIIVDTETKEFDVQVGVPSTAALLLRAANAEKGSGKPGVDYIADLPFDKIVEIARVRMPYSYSRDLKAAVKEVLGTCVSIGIKVDGRDAKQVVALVEKGHYDNKLGN